MKSYLLAVAIFSLSIFAFAGCANQSSQSATTDANPTDRTYTRKDIQNSGRQDTAGAAQALEMVLDDFLTEAGRHGLYAIDYDVDDFKRELDGIPHDRR